MLIALIFTMFLPVVDMRNKEVRKQKKHQTDFPVAAMRNNLLL